MHSSWFSFQCSQWVRYSLNVSLPKYFNTHGQSQEAKISNHKKIVWTSFGAATLFYQNINKKELLRLHFQFCFQEASLTQNENLPQTTV